MNDNNTTWNLDNSGLARARAESQRIWQQMEGDARENLHKIEEVYNQVLSAIGSTSIDASLADGIEKVNITIIAGQLSLNEKKKMLDEDYRISYLRQYGEFQEKILAISEEYDAKIAAASGEWEKKTLEKQKTEALTSVIESSAKGSDFWVKMFRDAAEGSVASVKEIMGASQELSDYVKNTDVGDITDQTFGSFGFTAEQLKMLKETPGLLDAMTKAFAKSEKAAKSSPWETFTDSMDKALEKIKKGDVSSIGAGIVDAGSAITTFLPTVKQFGTDIGTIFGEDMGKAINDVASGLGGVADMGVGVGRIMSGDVVGGVMSAVSGIAKIATVFKGYSKEARDTKQLEKVTSKLALSNEAINKLIANRITLIKQSTAAEAASLNVQTKNEITHQQQYSRNAFKGLMGNEIFTKKGKKNNKTLKKLMEDEGLNDIDDFAKWWSGGGYNNLLIQGFSIKNKEKWDALAKGWVDVEKAKADLEKANKEISTGTTFDQLKDSLDDLVKQADLAFGDVSKSFEGHMSKAVLNMVKSQYLTNALQGWYDTFAKNAESGERLTQDEVMDLRKQYEDIVKNANKRYNDAMAIIGTTSGQEASVDTREGLSRGVATASQDSINDLDGRATNIQQHTYDIRAFNERIAASSETIQAHTSRIAEQWQDFRAHSAQVLLHLSGIEYNTNSIPLMASTLNEIATRGVKLRQ